MVVCSHLTLGQIWGELARFSGLQSFAPKRLALGSGSTLPLPCCWRSVCHIWVVGAERSFGKSHWLEMMGTLFRNVGVGLVATASCIILYRTILSALLHPYQPSQRYFEQSWGRHTGGRFDYQQALHESLRGCCFVLASSKGEEAEECRQRTVSFWTTCSRFLLGGCQLVGGSGYQPAPMIPKTMECLVKHALLGISLAENGHFNQPRHPACDRPHTPRTIHLLAKRASSKEDLHCPPLS